jgi:phosphate-selective porin OprO/OprP
MRVCALGFHVCQSTPVVRVLASAVAFSILFTFSVSTVWAQGNPAGAAPVTLDARVRELEETVKRLQAERAPDNAPAAGVVVSVAQPANPPAVVVPPADQPISIKLPQETPGVHAGWDNGFFIRSADKAYLLRITGQIQTDYRGYLDAHDQTDIDQFILRRARFGIEATVFEHYEFRFLPDFGLGKAVIQDSYLNVHYWDALQFEVGKFKQPFSYEELIQDRFVPTLERSMIDQIVPSRDVGAMIHGQKLFGDRFDFAVAVSNGEINGDGDTNNQKDFAGRVAVRPLNWDELWTSVRGLQVGVAGTIGIEQEPVSPSTMRTPATVPWFQFNSTVRADGLRTRWSPELVYFWNSFGFAAQYMRQEQKLQPSAIGASSAYVINVPTDGYYVMATFLLTGEERTTYSQAIVPNAPFNPCHPCQCAGAWELVARFSHLELGDEVFAPGTRRLADPTRNSRATSELTLGVNWYLNAWVRTQINWEHDWFESPVRLGTGPQGLFRHHDNLAARFQVIF